MSKVVEAVNEILLHFEDPADALSRCIEGCYTKYPLKSIKDIRKLLNRPRNALIQQLIDSGVMSRIVALLKENNYNFQMLSAGILREIQFDYNVPIVIINSIEKTCEMYCIDDELQQECRNILVKIAGGNSIQKQHVIDKGAIPALLNGLSIETSIGVKEASLKALINIVEQDQTATVVTSNNYDAIEYFVDRINSIMNDLGDNEDLGSEMDGKLMNISLKVINKLCRVTANINGQRRLNLFGTQFLKNLRKYWDYSVIGGH